MRERPQSWGPLVCGCFAPVSASSSCGLFFLCVSASLRDTMSERLCSHEKSVLTKTQVLGSAHMTHGDLILPRLSAETLLPNKVTFTGPGDSKLNTAPTSVSPTRPDPQGHQPRNVKERPSLAQGGWRRAPGSVRLAGRVRLWAGAPLGHPDSPSVCWSLGTICDASVYCHIWNRAPFSSFSLLVCFVT